MNRRIELLAQADLLLLMADLFRSPDNVKRPIMTLRKKDVKALFDATGLKRKTQLVDQLFRIVQLASQMDKQQWAGCYRLLFDGSIVCPINEAAFIRRDKGAIIGDICGFYNAFGWSLQDESGERPDHLLAELEFVAMLLVMMACANKQEKIGTTESALREFTRQHLNDWLPLFCQQLKISTTLPIFVESANLLDSVWAECIRWHDWVVDPPSKSTVGICEEPENPYECGAPDLVSIGSQSH